MKNQSFNSKNIEYTEDDFDLSIFWNTFLRNKKNIILISLLSGFLSFIYSTSIKPIWVGSFDIVVRENKRNKSQEASLDLKDVLRSQSLNDTKTQALILKSSSVLFPVFKFARNEYLVRGLNRDDISYSKWFKTYLDVKFAENSKVLKIEYKDNDKDLILKVLDQISTKYKEYSKRDRQRSIAKTIQYLKEQKKSLEERSFDSLKAVNEFSLENGLGNIEGFYEFDNDTEEKSNASKIRKRYTSQIQALELYESRYFELSSKLKKNSSLLKSLEIKINKMRESLKRPGKILIEYQNLRRIALRDIELLGNIDKTLEISKLEQAQIPDVWEIISLPTIKDEKYFPNKKLFLLAGLSISFFGSLLGSYIKEKLSGFIYDKNLIKKLINTNLIDSLNSSNLEFNKKFLNNIFSKLKGNKNILINCSSTRFTDEDIFIKFKNLIFEEEVLKEADNILIIIEEGETKYDDLLLINKYILLNEDKIMGWIFIQK